MSDEARNGLIRCAGFEQEATETTEKQPILHFLCFLLFDGLHSSLWA